MPKDIPRFDDWVKTVKPRRYDTESALDLISQHESGGRNIKQQVVPPGGGYNPSVGRVTGPSTASGPWQITNSTWRKRAPREIVSKYPTAISAPVEVQRQVAGKIYNETGFRDWEPYNASLRKAIARGDQPKPTVPKEIPKFDDWVSQQSTPPVSTPVRSQKSPFTGVRAGASGSTAPTSPYSMDRILARPQVREPTFDEDRIQRARGGKNLRMAEEESMSQLRRVRGQVAAEPNRRANARLLEPKLSDEEEVLRRISEETTTGAEQTRRTAEYEKNKPEIDRLAKIYRTAIRGGDLAGVQWGSETAAKGVAPLIEKLAGIGQVVASGGSPGAQGGVETLRLHAQALQQAAMEEGASRSEASKFVQDIAGGFIGTAPELAAMSVGVPAPVAFAAGSGTQAYGRGEPVAPAAAHGALTGAAFEIPVAGQGLRRVARKAGAAGTATTGIELASGASPREAAVTGLTNAALVGVPGVIGRRRNAVRSRSSEIAKTTETPDGASDAQRNQRTQGDTTSEATKILGDAGTVRRATEAERVSNARKTETQRQSVSAEQSRVEVPEGVRVRPLAEETARPVDVRDTAAPSVARDNRVAEAEIPANTETPQRFQHVDFGEVQVAADQTNARSGRVKVEEVNDPTKIHYVKQSDMQGRGNARMIPLKETPPAEPTVSPELQNEAETAILASPAKPQERIKDVETKVTEQAATKARASLGESRPRRAGDAETREVSQAEEPQRVEDVEPSRPASVKAFITKADEAALKARGYSDQDIYRMKPQEAQEILDAAVVQERVAVSPTEKNLVSESATPSRALPVERESIVDRPAVAGEVPEWIKIEARRDNPSAPESLIEKVVGRGLGGGDVPDVTLGDRYRKNGFWYQKGTPNFMGGADTRVTDPRTQTKWDIEYEMERPSTQRVASPKTPSTTAVKNAALTIDRVARELPELAQAEPRKAVEVHQKAIDANAKDPRAVDRLTEQALGGEKNFTDVETAQVRLRAQEIKNRTNELLKEIDATNNPTEIGNKRLELDSLTNEFDRLSQAAKKAGTEWGRAGVARQQAIDQDFNLVAMKARLKADKGAPLSKEQNARVEDLDRRLRAAEERADKAEARAVQAELESQLKRVTRQRQRAETKQSLDQEVVIIKSNIAAELARIKSSSVQASGLAGLDPEGRLTKELIKYVHNRAKANIGLKAEALIDEAHELVKDLGVSRRQVAEALVGYGVPSKRLSEMQRRVRAVDAEIESLLKEQDVIAGRRTARRQGPSLRDAPVVSHPRPSEARQSGVPLQGPKLGDIRKVPMQGPRMSEASHSGQPLQGPKMSEARKLPMIGPRLSDIRKVRKVEGPKMVEHGPSKDIYSKNQARLKMLEKEKTELERRMREGDFSEKPKREGPRYTRETLSAQKEVEKIKAEYNRMRYKATRSTGGKITDELAKAANVPKTLKSIGDISAVFRQGGFYAITHPIEGGVKPFKEMVKSFTDLGWRNVEAKIKEDPDFETLRKAGTEFTGVDKNDPHLSHHEEGYLGKEYLDYVPIAKQVAGFSERTFVSLLDAQRLFRGKQILRGMTEAQRRNPEELKAIARLLNTGTGRGSLGRRGNAIAPALNIAMFSPRLLASRVQLLNNMFNPVTIARMPAGARKAMIKDNIKFLGATAAIISLAKASGATVSLDPDDSEFLKIRFGDTVYDNLTGLQQPLRYIINMTRGLTGGETYPGEDIGTMTKKFARSKANPALAPVINRLAGSDFEGRKFSLKREAKEMLVPLPAKDVYEGLKQGGILGALKATPTFTGIGVGSYPQAAEKPVTTGEKLTRKFVRESMPPDQGREEEQIETDRKKAQLRARSRRGEDVSAEVKSLGLTERQTKSILGARNQTRLQEDFKRLSLQKALTAYSAYSPAERESVNKLMGEKAKTVDALPADEQAEVRKRLLGYGFKPGMTRPKAPERPKRPERQDRYAWSTP